MIGPATAGLLLAASVLGWPSARPARVRLALLGRRTADDRADADRPPAHYGPTGGGAASRAGALGLRALGGGGVTRLDGAERAELDRGLLTLVEGLAAALRAGLTPSRALSHLAAMAESAVVPADPRVTLRRWRSVRRRVAADAALTGVVARLSAQAFEGAPLEPVWRAAAERLRSATLLAVAEGWAMSEQQGAPVVDVLDSLVAALRDQARTAAAIETSLAAPRATAALLGVLPIGGVLLGELVGVDPLAVLVGTPAGRAAGLAGLAATIGGRIWMRRLVRAVEGG
jgi:tight adherence protein B